MSERERGVPRKPDEREPEPRRPDEREPGSQPIESPTVEVPRVDPSEAATVSMPALPRHPANGGNPEDRPPGRGTTGNGRSDSGATGSGPTGSTADDESRYSRPVPFDEPTIVLPRIGFRAALDRLEAEERAARQGAPPPDETPTEPTGSTEGTEPPADTAPAPGRPASAAGIGRASGIMAIGTLASRVTGFLRTVALAVAIGTGVIGDAYNVANTTPNILYDLLLGGVLTSVVVPVLARAAREDDDGGDAFASSLLTLVVVALTVVTLIGVVVAPLLVRLYISRSDQVHVATELLRYFLPQVVFYGVGATIGAILNLRNRFAAPMATPVLNNLIVIATCGVFVAVAHIEPDRINTISSGEVALLGIGTTLGIVVMTLALLPSLRASGFRYRPRIDLRHPGLRSAGRLAGWVLLFVVTNQVALTVVTRLASAAVAYTTWSYAYQLFQLPHAIIAVSVITALLPRMSRHAAENRIDLVRDDLSTGLRLAAVIIVPAAFGLLVLSTPICIAIFAHGATSIHDASRIGAALAGFAVALVPFSSFQLQLRAFYALADSRTPTFVNFSVAGTNIVAGVLLSVVLPERDRAVALALAFAAAYLVGTVVCARLLVRRLAGMDAPRIARTVARAAVAGAIAALLAFVISAGVRAVVGSGSAGSLLAVAVAGLVGIAVYGLLAVRMRISELTSLVGTVRRRFGR